MIFLEKYKILKSNSFSNGGYSIVPIRYDDRFKIMEWRNEQMYHLRQASLLTKEDQENYFKNVVANLFDQEKPNQILFSYLKDEECIGYGGLVHINWIDHHAEISFIMKTELEKDEFDQHWSIYLDLIEKVAFEELNLHKIFTYAFDLRPHLYNALDKKSYVKEAVLKEHCFFNDKYIDCVIHSKINRKLNLRPIKESDINVTFSWANDPETRNNSFNSKLIKLEEHSKWFLSKVNDENAHYYICEVNGRPAGLVRFDYDKATRAYIIGITIDQNFRGKKLATSFLKQACESFTVTSEDTILAFIKEENIASKKAFERAGFVFQQRETINESQALKYEYRNE